jgi:glyoxylase-like metal-dependent hydrolase (beta-lactamase superfamily II)
VVGVKTLDNAMLPYPTRFAFNGVVPLPWPMVVMLHRTLLVQLKTAEGVKNLLFNPTDAEAARKAPFFAKLEARITKIAPFTEKLITNRFASLEQQLAELGLVPADIDVIAYDHFHTQDLRPVLGTGNGVAGRFPNAFLLAPRREWSDWDGLHPMQKPWFIEDGKRGVPDARVVLTDTDLCLGEGCLLIQTPGHTTGNQTLIVHGADGVFGCSENGTSADNWSPRASSIPGLRRFAAYYDAEVVLNSNTPELGGEQYTSMVLERSLVDAVPGRPDFVQMFPSSEVTASALAPRIRPSVVFKHRDSGRFARV